MRCEPQVITDRFHATGDTLIYVSGRIGNRRAGLAGQIGQVFSRLVQLGLQSLVIHVGQNRMRHRVRTYLVALIQPQPQLVGRHEIPQPLRVAHWHCSVVRTYERHDREHQGGVTVLRKDWRRIGKVIAVSIIKCNHHSPGFDGDNTA